MEIEEVLYKWKLYQNIKLTMANSFPCTVTHSNISDFIHGNLTFIVTQGERRMEVRNNFNTASIPLRVISGSTPEGSIIRFSLFDGEFILMRFPNEEIQRIVRREYGIFEREEHGLTPSMSSGSE
ncbi:uncharacterized protein [Euwallacea similis]|uniref:uncharacterized protein isoform X1 n=2 Tax=Euwallacea similis TaxID=1736056 RepID=UPI00344F38D3